MHYLRYCVATAMLYCFAYAQAEGGPPQKPGLWETKIETRAGKMVSQMCLDEATIAAFRATTPKHRCVTKEVRGSQIRFASS